MASQPSVSRMNFRLSDVLLRVGFLLPLFLCSLALTTALALDQPPQVGNPDADSPNDTQYVGRVITVAAPITDQVEKRVRRIVGQLIADAKRDESRPWPIVIFEFQPGASDLGKAFDFAEYLTSGALSGATTVAYVPESLAGNVVLPVIACDEIVMHPDAELGNAGRDIASIGNSERGLYRDIAERRKTIPKAIALGMLDPNLEVLTVETEVSREFVLSEELDDLRENKAIQSEDVLFRPGEVHVLTAAQARQLGLVKLLAQDVSEVTKAWGLPREALQQDPSIGASWRAIRVPLEGPISASQVEQVQSMIDEAIRKRGVNFVCLWVDSPGGSPTASVSLANYLASLDPSECRTVAYIVGEARADAAFIVAACDQVVMLEGSTLGGPGAFQMEDPDDVRLTAESLREIARRKFRSPTLTAALVDPTIEVNRYRRKSDGATEFYTPSELEGLEDTEDWELVNQVKAEGVPLQVDSNEAVDLGLTSHAVDNFQGFKELYSLENDPELVEPGWAHFLIDALRSPSVAWLLLVLGGAALYAEIQAPGIGIGAFVGAVCFLVFFWAMHLGGTAGWLEALLFLAGIVFLLLEVFVLPGFGIFGLGGGLLVLSSLLLASQTFVIPRNEYQLGQFQNSMMMVAAAGAGIIFSVAVLRRFLPHIPMFNQLIQAPPTDEELSDLSERESLAHSADLIGQRGHTVTQLTPGGKAQFGNDVVDVLCDGEVISAGAEVEVVEARSNRIVVREVE